MRLFLISMIMTVIGCSSLTVEFDGLPPQGPDAQYLMLVVHGSGDTAESWPAQFISSIRQRLADPEQWDLVAYDWSRYAEDKSRASQYGLALGTQIGSLLASERYSYRHIHFTGHSVGAFVVDAAAAAYREEASKPAARIHLTLLDPFTGNGFIDWTYGKRNFGTSADFADAYVNTDDPVPSTNGTISNAHNFDVTQNSLKPPAEGSEAHWWPVEYYLLTIEDPKLSCGFQLTLSVTGADNPVSHGDFPRGATTALY